MAKVKTIMIGARAAGTLSRSTVMIIGNGMVRSNNPILLKGIWRIVANGKGLEGLG